MNRGGQMARACWVSPKHDIVSLTQDRPGLMIRRANLTRRAWDTTQPSGPAQHDTYSTVLRLDPIQYDMYIGV